MLDCRDAIASKNYCRICKTISVHRYVDIIKLTGPDVLSWISMGQGPERKGKKEEKRMNFMNMDIILNSLSV